MTSSKSGKVRRRSPGEVRPLILQSALELFETRGYPGTTTREIADRAGVAEALVFRHFGSKAELYSEAVLGPMVDFIDEWVEFMARRRQSEKFMPEAWVQEFVERFYDVVVANRGRLLSYLSLAEFEPELVRDLEHHSAFQEALRNLDRSTASDADLLGIEGPVDLSLWTRSAVGMVLAMGLFCDLAAPPGMNPPSRRRTVAVMSEILVEGSFARSRRVRDTSPSSRSRAATTKR